MPRFLSSLVPAALFFSVTAISGLALADDEFDVTAAGNKITVNTKGGWHINKEYPWKVEGTAGGKEVKIKKDAFKLGETSATVEGAPAGSVKLKGAVCQTAADGKPGSCKSFEKTLTL